MLSRTDSSRCTAEDEQQCFTQLYCSYAARTDSTLRSGLIELKMMQKVLRSDETKILFLDAIPFTTHIALSFVKPNKVESTRSVIKQEKIPAQHCKLKDVLSSAVWDVKTACIQGKTM